MPGLRLLAVVLVLDGLLKLLSFGGGVEVLVKQLLKRREIAVEVLNDLRRQIF